jgi:predicted permease
VAPPLAIAAVGYLLGRWRDVDVEPLSTVTIYVLMPALIFDSLVTMPLAGGTALALVGAMVAFTASMAAIAALVGRAAGEDGAVLAGATLAAAFPNVGNFGIPVAAFAFGAVGRTTAVIFVVVQNVLMHTAGVYALSRGGDAGSHRAALRRVLSLPLAYAVVAAGIAVALGIVPPENGPIMSAVSMTGDASIPVFLLILGLQLADMDAGMAARRTVPTVGLKVLIAPVLALGVALAAGIGDATAARSFVLLAAGPAAVTPLVLAIEFGGDPDDALSAADYVGTTILLTILGSLPVVTGLIYLLRTGTLL